MSRFYSKTTGGFYAADMRGDYEAAGSWPADSIEITAEQYAALLDSQASGATIRPDGNGLPIAVFPAPATLVETKVRLSAAVDSEISDIYSQFTRFTSEYQEREAAARVFKAAGYVGDAGPWVMSFATPAGKTATQAVDLIIAQADALKAALAALGALRMRKYEIAGATSATAAQAIYDDIVLKAQQAAAGL